MKEVQLIFPHQLFKNIDHLNPTRPIYLIEEYLFFNQYNFHKQKLCFHRASMKYYESYLLKNKFTVYYVEAIEKNSDVRKLIPELISCGLTKLFVIDPTDNWLEKHINTFANDVAIIQFENPSFLNSREELGTFFKSNKKKFFQTTFYKQQRIKRNILIENGGPTGGKWSFDDENRKKYPKSKNAPVIQTPPKNEFFDEAKKYIEKHFPNNLGDLSSPLYPITFEDAENWLNQFLEHRFKEFGDYEDAIVRNQNILNHSVLSPLINSGLLTPYNVLNIAIDFADKNNIPLNSLEGFVRQIIGWREFIRGIYEVKGTQERSTNFWNHKRRIPRSFYDGTTGIEPIDTTIKKTLQSGYAHHIERLMILGNFMLLCEFDPDEVYQWFMELFIDAYDWVMVPNVYGMALFADGGIMSTKPYISSSNYIKKMSDYPNGEWQAIWDGLFWRFMDKNRDFLSKNPRLKMLLSNLDKMSEEKRTQHMTNAETFLENLNNIKNSQLSLL